MKKQRLYLDYNATAPLASSVKEYLAFGDFIEANPASTHTSGKQARKLIQEVSSSFKQLFNIGDDHHLFFHSGATEAINTFFNLSSNDVMIYFASDHPVVHAVAHANKSKGCLVCELSVNSEGYFIEEELFQSLSQYQDKKIFLNYTYVHNETGVVWSLENLLRIKSKFSCHIHVDAVQSVGKIPHWEILEKSVDMYTYSGHKFGGLKGIGFSIINKSFKLRPLHLGGGQQMGFRSGTENTMGIVSLQLALEETKNSEQFTQQLTLRSNIENLIKEIFADSAFVVGENSPRACNTVCICFKNIQGDFAQIQLDLQGIDVSYGSACSSGSIKGSQTIAAMGWPELSKNIIRISFGLNDYKRESYILDVLEKAFRKL